MRNPQARLRAFPSVLTHFKSKLPANRLAHHPMAVLGILLMVAVSLVAFYLFHNVGPRPDFILPRRTNQLLAMGTVSVAIAYSSILFQTISGNRILTPGVIGFESVYMFIQTVIVFVFSSGHYFVQAVPNYLLSVVLMVLFSLVIYQYMFRRGGQNIYFLVLIGMVLGTMFGSLTSFMQMVIDPNEFMILQHRMFLSFNTVNQPLIVISLLLTGVAIGFSLFFFRYLDVLALGKEHAISLGVNHGRLSKLFLVVIAVLVAVSTALVGPITFLGVLITNLTYQLVHTYKHRYLVPICMLVTLITIVLGQYVISRIMNFSANLVVIINFVGGVYFIWLLLKERKW